MKHSVRLGGKKFFSGILILKLDFIIQKQLTDCHGVLLFFFSIINRFVATGANSTLFYSTLFSQTILRLMIPRACILYSLQNISFLLFVLSNHYLKRIYSVLRGGGRWLFSPS